MTKSKFEFGSRFSLHNSKLEYQNVVLDLDLNLIFMILSLVWVKHEKIQIPELWVLNLDHIQIKNIKKNQVQIIFYKNQIQVSNFNVSNQ